MTDEHVQIIPAPSIAIDEARLHPMARAMMSMDLTPEAVRDLMTLQREWEAGEAKKQYTRALVALKRDLPSVIGHDKKVDYTSEKGRTHYTHASLAQVMDAVTEILSQHGFSIGWRPQTTDRLVTVTCRLTHCEGHYEESPPISAPPDTSGRKNPAQAVTSTITLLQRYTALSLLGIATADMQEPTGEPSPSKPPDLVDVATNLKAQTAIRKSGRELPPDLVGGRGVKQWTSADLDAIRSWLYPEEGEA